MEVKMGILKCDYQTRFFRRVYRKKGSQFFCLFIQVNVLAQ